jgi:hypothetical protein
LADLCSGVSISIESGYTPLGAPQHLPASEAGRRGRPWIQAMFKAP